MRAKVFIKKLLICLILTLFSVYLFPININATDSNSTDISSAEDLIALAKNCRVDSYSRDKVFNITNDIDLRGKNFKGIPVFAGKLNGNNHIIKNLNIKSKDIEIGFIGTLAEKGSVDSLIIEGSLEADGIVRGIGGIVTANFGTITNCIFNGTVENITYIPNTEAEQVTGGIVGKNYNTGTISLCKAYGKIKGIKNTGGIVGTNEGQVIGCINYASVNKNAKDKGGSIFRDLKIRKLKDLTNILTFSKLYSCENYGGIAGYSTGDIYSSENKGNIGNSNNGYNVGGIVGKSTGYIQNCSNTGEILGNSNVGGICGQLEPGVIVKYTDNLVAEAKGDVDELFSIVDNTLDNSSVAISTVSSNVNNLFTNINKISKCAKQIETIVSDIADDKFEEVGQFKNVLIEAVQTLSSGIETIGKDTTKMTKDISSGINSILDIGEDISAILFPGIIEKKEVDYTVKINNPEFVDLIYTDETGAIDPDHAGYVGSTRLNLYRNGELVKYATLNLDAVQEDGVTLEAIDDTTWVVTFKVINVSDTGEPNYYYPEINDGTFPGMSGVTTPINVSKMYYREVAIGYDYCFQFFSHFGTSGQREAPTKDFHLTIDWNFDGQSMSSVMPEYYTIYIVNGSLVGKKVVYNSGTPTTSVDIEKVENVSNADFMFAIKPYDSDINSTIMGGIPANKLSKFESSYSKIDDNNIKLDIKYTGGISWGTEALIKLLFSAGAITGDVMEAIESFKGASSSLTDISNHLTETMKKFNEGSLPAIRRIELFKGISGDLDGKIDEFANYIIGASNSLSGINLSLNETQGTIVNGIRSIVDQANVMTDSVFETIYNAKDYISSIVSDESKDVSKEGYLDIYKGIIETCNNYGDIKGKLNVGGVTGSMSLSGIPVITEAEKGEDFGLPSISYRAVIKESINNADVQAKEGFAGLICGNQDFGAIVSCVANGNVNNDGDYTGGIAGYAHGLISDCAFKGSLKGNNYIGGIAGVTSTKDLLVSESNLSNNYSNLKLNDHNKFIGAISGNYAGSFKNNYYYCDETEGVNTYAIAGEYEPVAAKVVNNRAVINSDKCFVRYVASGNIIDEVEITKGTSVPNALVPNIPNIPGLIGFWFNSDLFNLNKNQIVTAIYIPHPIIIVLIIILIVLIIYIIKKKNIRIKLPKIKIFKKN